MHKENIFGPDLLTPMSEEEIALALHFAEHDRASCMDSYAKYGTANFLRIAQDWERVIAALHAKDTEYMAENKQRLKWWAWHQAGMNKRSAHAAETPCVTV